MQSEKFEQRVRELKEAKVPSCPLGIEAAVLRRVRERQHSTPLSITEWLSQWAMRPVFATAVLSAVVFMSIASSALAVNLRHPSKSEMARVSLGFDTLLSSSLTLDLDRP
tara:strand:+ start:351 stop:680 length:330 start_codon:yes stop_codon:yes gene_type:complete